MDDYCIINLAFQEGINAKAATGRLNHFDF
jgi:hypothetical protein